VLAVYRSQPTPAERARAALFALAGLALLGFALITGFGGASLNSIDDALKTFEVLPPDPPIPPPVPRQQAATDPEGAAAPPNIHSQATEIVAPLPVLPQPSPLPAANVAGSGGEMTQGASPVAGPGTGAGGVGDGTGAGGDGGGGGGGGDGGGGDGGEGGEPPRLVRGRLKDSDYPRNLGAAGVGGTVSVRYFVGENGRVGECAITRSSGNEELDALTCRLIRERFRFRPSLDEDGKPVGSFLVEKHSWLVRDDPQ